MQRECRWWVHPCIPILTKYHWYDDGFETDFINLSHFTVNVVCVPKTFIDSYTRFYWSLLFLSSRPLAEDLCGQLCAQKVILKF